MSIHESIATVRAVSDKDIWKQKTRDSVALAKVSSRTSPTGIIVSDNSREIGAFLSEYYHLHCYTHRNAKLAARQIDATKLQFAILGWANRERILDALAWIRTISNLPAIVTGPASEPACVAALEAGAADYMVDSVGKRELLARIRAVLRYHQPLPKPKRESRAEGHIYEFGEWRCDARNRRLTGPQGLNVALTRSEYALLKVFLEAPKRVLGRESLLRGIRIAGGVADRSVDVLVLRLRRKLSAVAPEDRIIATERGAGYRFAMPVKRHSLHPADQQNRQRAAAAPARRSRPESAPRQDCGVDRSREAEPDLLVCDEPVSSLDVMTQAHMLDLLVALQARLRLAMLFISHDLGVIQHVSHRIAVMEAGRIVETGTVDQVFDHPQHPSTRRLLGAVPRLDFDRGRADACERSPLPPRCAVIANETRFLCT
jgi:two-component system OmpR family response regulator